MCIRDRCTATSTRTTRTRQNKPYRHGAVPARVVEARSRCCPPATVPAAVVFACGVCCCIADIKQIVRIKSSTEKQSSAIIVHKQKRTATSTRTTRTKQNNPYRFGAVPAGVKGARGRCCPAATVSAAVALPCGVCCCIAENKQKQISKKSSTEKQSSAIIVYKPKRTATSMRTIHNTEQALPAWRGAGRSSRGTKPLLSSGDGARSCRIRLWCLLLYCGYQTNCSNKIVNRKTELCHHRPQTKAHSNEYENNACLLYTSPSPRDATLSRIPSSA